MPETLSERSYFVLKGLYEETVAKCVKGKRLVKSRLPRSEPAYPKVTQLLRQLVDQELFKSADNSLIKDIDDLLSFGDTWEQVFPRIFWDTKGTHHLLDYNKLMLKIMKSLKGKLIEQHPDTEHITLDRKLLDEDMEFFIIKIPGYENQVHTNIPGSKAKVKEHQISITPPSRIEMKGPLPGDPRVYLHNPLRENIVFVKDRFLGERFSKYLIPFMKKHKLSLYLCSVETMLDHLAEKYAKDKVFNLVAVSTKPYLRSVDDRTLFIVLEKDEQGYKPVEIAYGGLLSMVPLVQMETFAFCAGVTPDDIRVIEINNQFGKFERVNNKPVLDPSRIALLGWWSGSFRRVVELYFQQSIRIILFDLVFEVINFMNEKGLPVTPNLFKDAAANGFSVDDVISDEKLRTGFRYSFFNYLQTSYQKEHTELSTDYMLEKIYHILSLTRLSDDMKEDIRLKREEVMELLDQSDETRTTLAEQKKKIKLFNSQGAQLKGDEQKMHQRMLAELKDNHNKEVDNLKRSQHAAITGRYHLYDSAYDEESFKKQRIFFGKNEYKTIKKHLLDIENNVNMKAGLKSSFQEMLDPVFDKDLLVDIGQKRMVSFIPTERVPVEATAEELAKRGFKAVIFYGTSGGVKNAPVEAFIIPKVVYFYPNSQYRMAPEHYAPLPIENILLDKSAENFFNTDNFYKTDHLFVGATYQEHEDYYRRVRDLFKGNKRSVSVDMDLAPLAKVCLDQGMEFGAILYNTDVLKGFHQEQDKKGYYLRFMTLSFLRAFQSKQIKFNNKTVSQLFEDDFKQMMKLHIADVLEGKVGKKDAKITFFKRVAA